MARWRQVPSKEGSVRESWMSLGDAPVLVRDLGYSVVFTLRGVSCPELSCLFCHFGDKAARMKIQPFRTQDSEKKGHMTAL